MSRKPKPTATQTEEATPPPLDPAAQDIATSVDTLAAVAERERAAPDLRIETWKPRLRELIPQAKEALRKLAAFRQRIAAPLAKVQAVTYPASLRPRLVAEIQGYVDALTDRHAESQLTKGVETGEGLLADRRVGRGDPGMLASEACGEMAGVLGKPRDLEDMYARLHQALVRAAALYEGAPVAEWFPVIWAPTVERPDLSTSVCQASAPPLMDFDPYNPRGER